MSWPVAALAAVSAFSSISAGSSARKSANEEAGLIRQQGALAESEAYENASRLADERREFMKTQKLAFLKNGVTLAGSPLLVLEKTRSESQREVNSLVKRGSAQRSLAYSQAAITERKGRSAFLSGFGDAAGTAVSLYGTQSLFNATK